MSTSKTKTKTKSERPEAVEDEVRSRWPAGWGVRRRLDWLLTAIVVVMLAVGVTGFVAARQIHHRPELRNQALTNPAATAEVQTAVSRTLVQVLTYNYADPAPTQQAAQQFLAGAARDQYATLFKTLKQKAPGQKLVLTAQVQSAGVKTLTGDTSTLLVFLDQASQRVTDKQASISAAELQVDAERIEGTWKVTGITPL